MPDDFTITVRDTAHGVELAVTGELDAASTAPLKEALHATTRVVGAVVVVDAAAVTFIDSTGLYTLLDADRALEAIGGRLYLINRSAVVNRVLQLAGLSEHFPDRPAAVSRPLVGDFAALEEQLRAIITELARTTLTATSLRDDLEELIQFGCQVVPGCSSASIALLVDGSPTTVAVSEHVALELDIVQYDNQNGPCLAALNGERIRVDIVEADQRFRHFAIGAADHHVNSVLSMPIVHHHDVVGTLNFYSHEADAFDDTAEQIARLVSGQVAAAIARSDVLSAARERRHQLQARYDETVLGARAQGVLIATQYCSTEQARNILQHAAQTTGDTILTISQRILETARNRPSS